MICKMSYFRIMVRRCQQCFWRNTTYIKQVPPRVEYFSIAVLRPSCAQRIAATYPPGPEP
jgi:hypothetical protein